MGQIMCLLGVSGSGKTTMMKNLIHELQNEQSTIGGIFTLGDFNQEGQRENFWVCDVITQQKILLAKRGLGNVATTQGPFGFTAEGLEFGNHCLHSAISSKVDTLFIDEIGPLELRGKGWYPSLQLLSKIDISKVVFTSRPTAVAQICDTFFPNRDVEKIEVRI